MAGLVAGALGGLAKAAGGMAQGYIDDERKTDVASQLSQMEEQRQMRITERQETMRRASRGADFEQDLANAPRKLETEVTRERALGGVKTAEEVSRVGLIGGAKTAQEIADSKARGGDKGYLDSERAIANAGRADPRYSPSELANAEATRMAVGDEKKRRELLQQRADIEEGNLRGDQRVRALTRIDKQMEQLRQARGAKKTDDQDTVKQVEEKFTYDDSGQKTGVTRTESSERRAVPPGKKAAEPAGAAKIAQNKAHEQAQAAIAKGADKDKVNARLIERGYAPLP